MYEFRSLNFVSYKEINECFNLAFSDYSIPAQFSEADLEKRLTASDVNMELSFGAFCDEKMTGFIINSCNTYNGVTVVFDVATAIVPEHRGNKLFSSLFDYVEQQIKQKGVEKYYLEVLQENEKAIKIYTKKGFKIEREFSVLKGPDVTNSNDSFDKVKTVNLKDFNSQSTAKCVSSPPSYEHSAGVLNRHNDLYQVDFTEDQKGVTAFCIYATQRGSIAQLGYSCEDDLRLLLQKLISTNPNPIAKNIDIKYTQILDILYDLGFTEVTKQFEMYKQL